MALADELRKIAQNGEKQERAKKIESQQRKLENERHQELMKPGLMKFEVDRIVEWMINGLKNVVQQGNYQTTHKGKKAEFQLEIPEVLGGNTYITAFGLSNEYAGTEIKLINCDYRNRSRDLIPSWTQKGVIYLTNEGKDVVTQAQQRLETEGINSRMIIITTVRRRDPAVTPQFKDIERKFGLFEKYSYTSSIRNHDEARIRFRVILVGEMMF